MRRPVQFALGAVIVLLLAATGVLFTKYQKSTSDYREMKASEESARARYSQTIDAIAEIQDSLNAISPGEKPMVSGDLIAEQQLSGPNGQQALDRIADLRASIARNKDRITQLESSLKKSGIKVAGLERMIANLKQTVTEKQDLITQLSGQVETLNTQVAGLSTEVQESQQTIAARDEAIEAKRRELATVYVAMGTKRELAASGVIEAKGGVLGLGKTLQPSTHVSETSFTPLDTDQNTVVQTTAAKVQVLSAQPASSYELRLVGGRVELHITDPTEFRKVRHLVIVTA